MRLTVFYDSKNPPSVMENAYTREEFCATWNSYGGCGESRLARDVDRRLAIEKIINLHSKIKAKHLLKNVNKFRKGNRYQSVLDVTLHLYFCHSAHILA